MLASIASIASVATLALGLLPSAARAQSGDLGCFKDGDWDFTCLVQRAQYTVYGEVVSNDLTTNATASPTDYNARIRVRCAWASYSTPPSTDVSLAGSTLSVQHFGNPHPLCNHSALGIDAKKGESQLFFLYVAQSPSANDTRTLYESTNPCTGSIPASGANLQVLANLLDASPTHRIGNPGSDAMCPHPPPDNAPVPNPAGTTTGTIKQQPSLNGTTAATNSAMSARGPQQHTLWLSAAILALVSHCLL
jgi:hypothetical protein